METGGWHAPSSPTGKATFHGTMWLNSLASRQRSKSRGEDGREGEREGGEGQRSGYRDIPHMWSRYRDIPHIHVSIGMGEWI